MRNDMFNPLRLFRRKDHIDDTATAYIEGRMTASDMAEIESRMAERPGLREELDSLKATVSLLRSIEPVRAPRSFALSHAPVTAPKRAGFRLAMAPAVIAIVAAAGVGMLAVGSLADVVSQSGSSNDASETASFERNGMSESQIEAQTGFAADTATTSPPLPSSTATPVPAGTPALSDGFAPVPEATETVTDSDIFGTGINSIEAPDLSDAQRNTGDAGLAASTGEDSELKSSQELDNAFAPPASQANGDDGLSLPLWQLEVALAALAGMMAATWAIMRRRASAEADF
jgi:ferric-dicitrate binding protein FerR (iron transport regulator)